MKVVILTNNQGNQRSLSCKIAKVSDVAAIVLSENIPRRKPGALSRAQTLVNRVGNRLAGRRLVETWWELLREYEKLYPEFPGVPVVRVGNVNDPATLETLEKFAPDLTVVSGTNLVGRKVIESAQRKRGIVNLHTGISPYVKGGPNCANWCLARNWFHLIGNTTMWLDPGIDTGNIIASGQTPLDGSESLFDLHWKVMQHGHDLYVNTIRRIAEGKKVASVKQNSIDEGKTFYTRDWNAIEIFKALRNYRDNYAKHFADADNHRRLSAALDLISLPD